MANGPEQDPRESPAVREAGGTWTRRDLVTWLGRAATVSLFAPWIEACVRSGLPGADPRPSGPPDLPAGLDDAPGEDLAGLQDPDGSAPDDGSGRDDGFDSWDSADPGAADPSSGEVCDPSFAPGSGDAPIFRDWNVRTVDPQDLAALLASWRLVIGGLVRQEVVLDFCALRDLGLVDQQTDFHCVEGWSVWDVPWNGIPLGQVLDLAGPLPEARFLRITSVRGLYTESLPLEVAREPKTLLALGIGGDLLPLAHGFPVRIVVPRLLGYKNPKYVARIDLTVTEHVGFWPRYGYSVSGEVPPERLREGKY